MTVKIVEPVQPENNINVFKDKMSVSSSREDHGIQSLLPNGNEIDHSLSKMVTDASCKNRTESSVNSLQYTRHLLKEKHLDTENTVKENAILSSTDSCTAVAKLSTKYRKSKGISKRLQYKKQRAANRNSLLFLHTWMGCVVMSILQLVQAETVDGSDVVTWDVKTKPIVFGETLELVCKIFDKDKLCNGSFQQWYGSKQDTLLCQDGKCRNEEKYTFKKTANCTNSLLIHNLSISDVDISYSCAFGRIEMKKRLMLKDYEILKLPRNRSVIPLVTTNNSIVDVSLKMDDIYPVPKCTVKLKKRHERDITNMSDISVNVTQDGIFYTYTMQIMQNVSQLECGSLLSVHCLIGSVVVTDLSKELDNCTDFNSITLGGNNRTISPLNVALVIVICVVVIGVVCISVLLYHIRKNPRRNHGYPVKVKQPEMVVGYTSDSCRLHNILSEETDEGYTSESSSLQTNYSEEIDQ